MDSRDFWVYAAVVVAVLLLVVAAVIWVKRQTEDKEEYWC